MMKGQMFSVDDLCAYIGICRSTVYKWIMTKNLPAYRMGRLWKFKKIEVDRWIKQRSF